MESMDVFATLKAIEIEKPVDIIIKQIKELIATGQLKPGDRLPAERLLAEKFGIGRGYIREAIMKLEFYGLLKTSPQSGTYVSGFSIKILDSIFSDIIKLSKNDHNSLIESRYFLELDAVKLAAERRTEQQVVEMKAILDEFDQKVRSNSYALDEDMLFHMKIAEATANAFLESMLILLIPDIIKIINENKVCPPEKQQMSIKQHHAILDAIIAQNPVAAENAMKDHLIKSFDQIF
jgi:GntR family transcriptional repressor for pyruvate dehydrogenase complex